MSGDIKTRRGEQQGVGLVGNGRSPAVDGHL